MVEQTANQQICDECGKNSCTFYDTYIKQRDRIPAGRCHRCLKEDCGGDIPQPYVGSPERCIFLRDFESGEISCPYSPVFEE